MTSTETATVVYFQAIIESLTSLAAEQQELLRRLTERMIRIEALTGHPQPCKGCGGR